MTKNEFLQLIENQYHHLVDLTRTKGEEYSRSDDQLANFKRNAADLNLTPEQIWAVYFNKHIDSIKSYIANPSKPLSEPIEGRINDAILYLLLFKAIVIEKDRNS